MASELLTGPRKNKGSALLSALFLMTLVAIAATAMSTRLQLDIYRTRLTLESDRLMLAVQALSFWAMDSLLNPNTKLKQKEEGGAVLVYPRSLAKLYPEMTMSGGLYDLQARFNLNNLQDVGYQSFFFRLLKNTFKKVELKDLQYIVTATTNWISPYQPARGVDDFMTYYYQQKPPYLPAYQPMQSLTEFRLVAGVNAEIYQKLYPHITALPTTTPINLNTASPAILKALGNGLTDTQLTELLQLRDQKGAFKASDILLLVSQFQIPAKQVTVESEYYLFSGKVNGKELSLNYYMVLHRSKDRTGTMTVQVVTETLNSM